MSGRSSLSGGSALDDELKKSNVVRLRGLPFSASEQDIKDFFKGLELGPDGVVIQVNFQGRSTGQAYVQFADPELANKALEKNRQHIGSRYIEVFKGHPADMQGALRMVGRGDAASGGGASSSGTLGGGGIGALAGLGGLGGGVGVGALGGVGGGAGGAGYGAAGGQMINGGAAGLAGTGIPGMSGNPDMRYTGVIRMRGMPYSCTAADITAFFKSMPIASDGIFLCSHTDGRPTGEAFVEFATEEGAARAMQLHREPMGSRYVELFRSTKGEMMTAIQQRMYSMYSGFSQFGGMGGMGMMGAYGMQGMNMSSVQQQAGLGGGMAGFDPTGENTCIKMRGLPYNAGQREIMDFFEGYHMLPGGVHLVMGATDRPTGECYVEFTSADEAARAMERHRQNIGSRYIELFRATKSEMLLALGGGLSGFNMAAVMADPNVQLLLLQQQQQLAAAGFGMGGFGMGGGASTAGYNMADMQQAAAAATRLYQQQAAAAAAAAAGSGGGAGGSAYNFDPSHGGERK